MMEVPAMAPPGSRVGETVRERQRSRPSLRRPRISSPQTRSPLRVSAIHRAIAARAAGAKSASAGRPMISSGA